MTTRKIVIPDDAYLNGFKAPSPLTFWRRGEICQFEGCIEYPRDWPINSWTPVCVLPEEVWPGPRVRIAGLTNPGQMIVFGFAWGQLMMFTDIATKHQHLYPIDGFWAVDLRRGEAS